MMLSFGRSRSPFLVPPYDAEVDLPFGPGRSVNPRWFFGHVIPGRLSELFSCCESTVHGDLNMKNVLIDETGNLSLIDFSDTRYCHIRYDIVKPEAVIMSGMVPLSSREMIADLVRAYCRFSPHGPGLRSRRFRIHVAIRRW